MFCVISKPITEAHAVAGELAAGIFFVLASIASYLGITFATNQDAQKALSDWFWSMGDNVKEFVQYAADTWVSGYNTIISWESSGWQSIVQSCNDFFSSFKYQSGVITSTFNITNPDGYIGFTADTAFSFTVPSGSDGTTVVYNLPSKGSTLGFFKNCNIQNLSSISDFSGKISGYYLSNPDGLIAYRVTLGECLLGVSFDHIYNSAYECYELHSIGLSYAISPKTLYQCSGYNGRFYSQKTNKLYSKVENSSYSGSFQLRADDGTLYTNSDGVNTWSSRLEFGNWFLDSCGFVVDNSSISDGSSQVYNPGSDDAIKVDSDRLSEKVAEAGSLTVDDTFSTVLPGTQEYLDEMQANPDLVTDVAAEGVYNSDIPAIKSDPLLWQNKFPFCLPFDLYNLFTGFNATAEAPIWHLLVLPANSFGLNNEAFYFDIDFGANGLDTFVKYMRFFIAAAFVVWLITITRKLIGGE